MLRTLLNRFFTRRHSIVERFAVALIAAGAVAAMLLSLCIGLKQSVWFDEAYSILLAKQSWEQLLYLTSIDTHPPLYYLLLKAWAAVFGWSELALRSLSVLALGGSILVGGLLVRRLFGVKAALIAVAMMVLSPFLLRYGFEIRMYALGSLIGVAATYVLVMAVQARQATEQVRYYALYALLVALGMYTLYYMALLWIAHLLWLVWMEWRRSRSVARLIRAPWVLAFLGAVVLFLPWLPTFLKQLNNGALAPIAQPLSVENLLGIVSFNFAYQPTWQLSPVGSLLIVFVVCAVTYFAIQAYKVISPKQRPYLILLGLYMSVPILVLALVSLQRPMYVERYLAHVTIGGLLFIGVAIALATSKKASKRVWLAAGLLFAILLSGAVHMAQIGNYNFQRAQQPAAQQASVSVDRCDDRTAVVAGDPYVAIELAYYLPSCQIYFYSEYDTLTGGYAPLSNSPLRVENPARLPDTTQTIYYIYDNQLDLQFPAEFEQVSEQSFDKLLVKKLSAE